MNTRLCAVKVLQQVIQHRTNLPDSLALYQNKIEDSEKALVQAICYGVIRYYTRLDFILEQLLDKKLKAKDVDIKLLIMTGVYQLSNMRIPDHAAVSETVKVTRLLKKPWAKNLVNALLRNFQRQESSISEKFNHNSEALYAHPTWWVNKIKQAWPDDWQDILKANNHNPPMTLRLNTGSMNRDEYITLLNKKDIKAEIGKVSPAAIRLEQPVAVSELPRFEDGLVSVQDEAAQLAAILLNPQPKDYILDACAAPGGKTVHILEQQTKIKLLAIDIDEKRVERISENLERTGLQADILVANAFKPDSWWDNQPFDRILLDAPCSASGVIRRHPDIKLLRKESDIKKLVADQQQILQSLWPLLKSGGMLLYSTCSVFPDENTRQIEQFLKQTPDAKLVSFPENITRQVGIQQNAGLQILTGKDGMDGFFYAGIQKK